MSVEYERLSYGLDSLPESDPFREGLIAVKDDPAEIRERFAAELAFGTAGLRGKLKAGTACMNYQVVGRAAQGLAD
ncbi:MAG: phospho-sugar mutase, partial [Lachnospiraceae bacterium]|nr:phospho-sugar mutase [Lachnospiraceae bacterium]